MKHKNNNKGLSISLIIANVPVLEIAELHLESLKPILAYILCF